MQAALQSSRQPINIPPALLHQAHGIDQQGAELLAQRAQAILAGLAGLQAYSAALRLVLGPTYADSSHHSQWAQALDTATATTDAEVSLQDASYFRQSCGRHAVHANSMQVSSLHSSRRNCRCQVVVACCAYQRAHAFVCRLCAELS